LAIELDGGGHIDVGQSAKDCQRDLHLLNMGIKTIRMSNHEIIEHLEETSQALDLLLAERLTKFSVG